MPPSPPLTAPSPLARRLRAARPFFHPQARRRPGPRRLTQLLAQLHDVLFRRGPRLLFGPQVLLQARARRPGPVRLFHRRFQIAAQLGIFLPDPLNLGKNIPDFLLERRIRLQPNRKFFVRRIHRQRRRDRLGWLRTLRPELRVRRPEGRQLLRGFAQLLRQLRRLAGVGRPAFAGAARRVAGTAGARRARLPLRPPRAPRHIG